MREGLEYLSGLKVPSVSEWRENQLGTIRGGQCGWLYQCMQPFRWHLPCPAVAEFTLAYAGIGGADVSKVPEQQQTLCATAESFRILLPFQIEACSQIMQMAYGTRRRPG